MLFILYILEIGVINNNLVFFVILHGIRFLVLFSSLVTLSHSNQSLDQTFSNITHTHKFVIAANKSAII
jgi:hypothetical protein